MQALPDVGRTLLDKPAVPPVRQLRFGVALLDRLDRFLGHDHAGLFARASVFQLHVLVHVEPRRIEAQPLGHHLANHLPLSAAARTSLLGLGNVDHLPPSLDVLGKRPTAVAFRPRLEVFGGLLLDRRDGRLDRLRAGNLEQHQLVRIDALAPRSVDSSQQQIEPMLQLLDLPLRRGQLLLLLENDLPEKLHSVAHSVMWRPARFFRDFRDHCCAGHHIRFSLHSS